MTTRRAFMRQASTAAGCSLLASFGRRGWNTDHFAPALAADDDALLRDLALKAVDAGRTAGASFADVRVGTGRTLIMRSDFNVSVPKPTMEPPELIATVGYGIRAMVDGAWGFATSYDLTADAIAEAARTAVAVARINRPRHRQSLPLAPAPRVEAGNWATPIERDPFTVPINEQAALGIEALAAVNAIEGSTGATFMLTWQRMTRVYASTDGSLSTQHLALASPYFTALSAERDLGGALVAVEGIRTGGYGYEAINATTLIERGREAARLAVANRKLLTRPVPIEIGRYDIVLAPNALAEVLSATLAPALNLERALGYYANSAGTSFAAPPDAVLGSYQAASKLVTLRADRSMPNGAATVGWDNEGVKPEPYTVVRDGIVTDYHTSRETAPALEAWYRSKGETVRSHGCLGGSMTSAPAVQLPNITVEPGRGDTSVEDIIADTQRGIYLDMLNGDSDQQLLSGQYAGFYAKQIVNGKLGGPVRDMAFQFTTMPFWKSLDVLGGAKSARRSLIDVGGSRDPLQMAFCTIAAVPARFKQVNVLNVGRTA